tara:strand:- start:846 stop:1472 length:627 start_codon:yes stop_codon:yes gene_type:complete
MPLSASQGYKIREEYSDIKEKKICDAHGLKQIGGSRTKIDGSDGISNKSIKNASGSSTQVHLTTQKHFCEILELDKNSIKFVELFCGNATIDNQGKDRYHTNEIDSKYLAEFNTFLEKNKLKVIDLIIRNGFNITHVVYNDIKNNIEYELTYEEIIAKIKDAEWEFKRGGIHLKLGKKSLFHFQREGKKKPSNRYNVLWHIHRNLFVC